MYNFAQGWVRRRAEGCCCWRLASATCRQRWRNFEFSAFLAASMLCTSPVLQLLHIILDLSTGNRLWSDLHALVCYKITRFPLPNKYYVYLTIYRFNQASSVVTRNDFCTLTPENELCFGLRSSWLLFWLPRDV